MKTVLTNDGGYWALEGVKFPVEVNAIQFADGVVRVSKKELVKAGGTEKVLSNGVSLLFKLEQGK